jgi:hypothetical protein
MARQGRGGSVSPPSGATLRAGAARTLELRLGPSLLRALEQHVRESGAFTLSTAKAGCPTRVVARSFLKL